MKKLIIGLIIFYQKYLSLPIKLINPAGSCRFYPTCSNYAIVAVDKYGAVKGGKLLTKRFLSCHPFAEGGFDSVP